MTKEEAKKYLHEYISRAEDMSQNVCIALDKALEALEYYEPCDDAISRQAAVDAIEFEITYARAINKETGEVKELFQEDNNELRKAVERVKALPPVTPA